MKHVDPRALPLKFRKDARAIRKLIDEAEQLAGGYEYDAALQVYKDAYRTSRQLPTRDLEIELTMLISRHLFECGRLDSALDWHATHCILLARDVRLQNGDTVTGNGITITFSETASLHDPGSDRIRVYRDFSETWKNPFVLEAMADETLPFGEVFAPARSLLLAIQATQP